MSSIEARALRLFDRFVEMPREERERELASLRREDPDLHAALKRLLDADDCSRIERAPIAAVAARMQSMEAQEDDSIGRQVGAWRIVGIIGHGGMGTVYEVERADGHFSQRAALKYVKAEVSSAQTESAFIEERNILASLRHPDIVPLLDGGLDEAGHPWFVMRRVDGEPIDAWCDRQSLTLRQRIELLATICDAVCYAHSRGIIHQDIKPSNILITADGKVQLLDFGLSMPAEGRADRRLAVTSGYCAPEVMAGGSLGFGVDVYALGVLLYQLACGQWPVPLNAVRHQPRPVSALVPGMTPQMLARRGEKDVEALSRKVRGELDSIALHCVETMPGERYESVADLQRDLKNWLSGAPVSAYGGGRWYRFKCFARCHAAASIVVSAVLGCLGMFAALYAWQHMHAERERVASSYADRLLESSLGMATLSGLGDAPLSSAAMLEKSEAYLRGESLDGHPEVRSRGLSVIARNWAAVGEYRRAEELVSEAIALGGADTLQTAFNLSTLAQVQNQQARHAEARQTARKGTALLKVRLSDQHRLAYARLLNQVAIAQSGLGDSGAAFQTLSQAVAEARQLPSLSSDAVVAQLLVQRGTWYRWRLRMKESEADLLRAIDLAGKEDVVIADDARESLVRTVRASRQSGREKRSLSLATALLASRQRTLGYRHPQTGIAWSELAFVRLLNADNPGAEEAIRHAESILRESLGETHPAYARTCIARAHLDALEGRHQSSIAGVEKGISIYRARYGETHEFTLEARFLLANRYWAEFSRTGDVEKRSQALDLIGKAIGDSVAAHGGVPAIHRLAYATLLANTGETAQAAEQLRTARADAVDQYGEGSQESLHIRATELSMAIDNDADAAWMEPAFNAIVADLGKVDTLYARAIAHTVWLERARWLRQQGASGKEDVRQALLNARDEAVKAGQPAWVAVADLRMRELEEDAPEAR
ncbi:serine/threonine-protein kinase [Pseudoxanthomonas putridarboris]|uniref:Serine/threonine-protein kinase n=1 Tax=Pseudoxanthomonas putridarboris TaxID=752605 RepID=A0ABU9J4N0_9GAMM